MAGMGYIKVTLKLMALYAGVMGAMAALFQDAGAFLFGYSIKDPVVLRYWGGVLFALAIFYLFLSYDPEKYRMLLWAGIIDLSQGLFITIFHFARGDIMWYQGIVAMVINPIFIMLVLSGLAHKDEGEVIFDVSGEGGTEHHHLPAHSGGKHPLHGK